MADYPSALTGAQMDAALLDVAQHNSEAWAVGTRNGFDVQSGDATYHNNSKYYAESAQSYAAIAQGAIPSGTAGALFYDRSQSLTDAQKMQGRANLAAGGSNENLLMNSWFGSAEVVNQRGATSGSTNNAYTIDRWLWSTGTGGASWSLGTNGVTLTPVSGSAGIWFQQQLPSNIWNYIIGKRCVGSVLLSDGTIRWGSVVIGTSANNYFWHTGDMEVYCGTSGKFLIYEKNTAVTIRAVKLELGSYSTLANDVPPDYNTELAKCRCYYERIVAGKHTTLGLGYPDGNNTLYIYFKINPKRGAISTTTFSQVSVGQGSMSTSASAVSTWHNTTNGEIILAVTATGAFTPGQIYRAGVLQGGYIDFSADL